MSQRNVKGSRCCALGVWKCHKINRLKEVGEFAVGYKANKFYAINDTQVSSLGSQLGPITVISISLGSTTDYKLYALQLTQCLNQPMHTFRLFEKAKETDLGLVVSAGPWT